MDQTFILIIVLGFVAQMIDGTLGMGYGVSANAFLLALGIPVAASSASVHAAKIFTTGVSGLSHFKMGNVNRDVVIKLAIPGAIGGIIGAYILTSIPSDVIKPFVAAYLIIMGLVILWKAFVQAPRQQVRTGLFPLGVAGGFFDAMGGGGWGPIVTTTMIARGNNPRKSIGTVNLAEFFVSVAQSITFFLTIGFVHWQVILGLIIGGVIAAPIAAFFCNRAPVRPLLASVALLIIFLNVRALYMMLP